MSRPAENVVSRRDADLTKAIYARVPVADRDRFADCPPGMGATPARSPQPRQSLGRYAMHYLSWRRGGLYIAPIACTGAPVSRNWHCQNTSKAAISASHGRHPLDAGRTDHGLRLWSGGMGTAPASKRPTAGYRLFELLIYPGAQCLCNRIRPFHGRQMAAVLHNIELRSGDSVRDRQGY
jgi:hypothetical protein